jgi:hypothetical protein
LDKIEKNVIYRVQQKPRSYDFQYLVGSEKITDLYSSVDIDIFTLKSYRLEADVKRKLRTNLGLEVLIADLRRADGRKIGKSFDDLAYVYKYCKSSGSQFILSSGACSVSEMVSGPCLDLILKMCGINPVGYWKDLYEWLQNKCRRRCVIAAQ